MFLPVRRVLLPRDDEEAMPPEEDGRAALSADETEELTRWIRELGGR